MLDFLAEVAHGSDDARSRLVALSPRIAGIVAAIAAYGRRFAAAVAVSDVRRGGEALGFLYNDSYAEILGAKHPRALGSRFHDVWSEIWPDISPLIDAAMSGEATFREDLPLVMNRKGYDEQTWFTFSYSPVRDESGKVAGMFCAVEETTRRVLAERTLRELNETLEHRVSEALAERKLLADIVEGTNAFVQVADREYRWLAINKAAADGSERIFGKRPQVGGSMLDLLADKPAHKPR
jgi:PAS domain-containing protein